MDTEVMEQAGKKSEIFPEENATGERSNKHAINKEDNSLYIFISHSVGKSNLDVSRFFLPIGLILSQNP
jgi:hypothetical protein